MDEWSWNSFELIKKRETKTTIISLPTFDKVFGVDCDSSNVGIGAVLSQEGNPITFFYETLSESYKKYLTYDKEFYAIVFFLSYILESQPPS